MDASQQQCREPGCRYLVGPTGAHGLCHGHYVRSINGSGLQGPLVHQVSLADVERAAARARYEAGGITIRVLAAEYGVGREQMRKIVRGIRPHGK